MMSAFDLSSEEDYESWIEKISFLYDCYGIDYVHTMKNGNHSLVCICYCMFELRERKPLETIWEGVRDNDWNGKGIKMV